MNQTLVKFFIIISVVLSISTGIAWLVLIRLLKKWENKQVEEVEYPLMTILRIIYICIVISAISGIIGILFRE